MKANIQKKLLRTLKSKMFLAFSGSMLLVSCGVYTGGYSETDGVYYDPNTDTLPVGVVTNDYGNRVGEYYDYQEQSAGIIQRSQQNEKEYNNRYYNENWSNADNTSSDWGTYSGSETRYNTWGYGYYPYGYGLGFYSPYRMWGGFGMGYGLSLGFGWGSPWGWGYDPFYSFSPWGWGYGSMYGWGYNPWGWNRFYNPYYGYYGGYYSPYYGGGYYNYNRVPMRKSGADGSYLNSGNSGRMPSTSRTPSNAGARVGNNTYRTPGFRTESSQPNRTGSYNSSTQRQYQQPRMESRSYDNRSFQNNSYNSGGFRSGGSSGFGGGSVGGGGMRSGGMRTGGGR